MLCDPGASFSRINAIEGSSRSLPLLLSFDLFPRSTTTKEGKEKFVCIATSPPRPHFLTCPLSCLSPPPRTLRNSPSLPRFLFTLQATTTFSPFLLRGLRSAGVIAGNCEIATRAWRLSGLTHSTVRAAAPHCNFLQSFQRGRS